MPSEYLNPQRNGWLCKLGLSKKVRHHSQFDIVIPDASKKYCPGEPINGHVMLKVEKAFDITHIVICLHGYAQVYKNPNTPGKGYTSYNESLINGRTSKAGGYYGQGFQSLFEDEIPLCRDGRLEAGTYQIGFQLQFPTAPLPSSINFERGTISYRVTCTITRPLRPSIINPIITQAVPIKYEDCIDVADLLKPQPRLIQLNPLKKSGTKPITCKIDIIKQGYLRGDSVDVRVSIHHNKPIKSMNGILLTLYRQSRIDYYPPLPRVESKLSNRHIFPRGPSFVGQGHCHTFRKMLDQRFTPMIIHESLQTDIMVSVKIPADTNPSISNVPGAMISFKYMLEVIVDLQAKLSGFSKFLQSGKFIDTEEIRRLDIYYTLFEIVVGTRDQNRSQVYEYIPLDESHLSEKGRHILAEQRILPSSPSSM